MEKQIKSNGFTLDFSERNQDLINRLKEAAEGLNVLSTINIQDEEYWKYFAYVVHSNTYNGYLDGFNQFLIANKNEVEKVVYYWYNSELLSHTISYSRKTNIDELFEYELNLLFNDNKKNGRPMLGSTIRYSLYGIERAKEYIKDGWDIYYEAYYHHKLIDENNFSTVFEE